MEMVYVGVAVQSVKTVSLTQLQGFCMPSKEVESWHSVHVGVLGIRVLRTLRLAFLQREGALTCASSR